MLSLQDAVREAVALVLGDLYLAFSSHRLGAELAAAAMDPGEDDLHALWLACEDVLALQVVSAFQDINSISLGSSGYP